MAILTVHAVTAFTRLKEKAILPRILFTGRIVFILLLFVGLIYTAVWLWIWDGTDDGLRAVFILMYGSATAVAAGMVIGLTRSGRHGWIGLPFAILVIAGLWTTPVLGGNFSSREITESRAVHIQHALEQFHAKTGSYPADLEALIPSELWRLPRPMIFNDQEWCYEGLAETYRLGAVYREHWSSPVLEVRVYASAGNPPETTWVCDEMLAQAREQHAMVFSDPPTPVPLPTSAISIARMTVEPVLRATSLSVGEWSPDGTYLVFGFTEYYGTLGDQMEIDLHFINAQTGEVAKPCT
jgi:hypothetical protein